jgi:hypothetical protein
VKLNLLEISFINPLQSNEKHLTQRSCVSVCDLVASSKRLGTCSNLTREVLIKAIGQFQLSAILIYRNAYFPQGYERAFIYDRTMVHPTDSSTDILKFDIVHYYDLYICISFVLFLNSISGLLSSL